MVVNILGTPFCIEKQAFIQLTNILHIYTFNSVCITEGFWTWEGKHVFQSNHPSYRCTLVVTS